ncbi:MAG: lipoyl(octanoyl) transferase LipB [Candidatus Caldarchaeum sp.]|nr:lipoyl(octanoyl) transferase LipB [Candidatus Caldarchaeum sp.]MDW8062649.1 lipoyl(octanoyl) transferase LipB [Candidatus Caldarchaeum sp.]
MSRGRLFFIDLGLIDYGICHRLMIDLVDKRAAGQIDDTVLLLEHNDVYTLGRRGSEENIFIKSIPVYRVERGGDATYHGPGQLVAYPIVSLNELGVGVADFVNIVEEAVIKVLSDFGVRGERVERKPGVWVGGRKVASVGMAVKNWVTYHGVALNVNTDLTKFNGIRPCGMDAQIMTSMAAILGKNVDIAEVKKRFMTWFSSLLKKEPEYTVHTVAETRDAAKVI